MVIVDTDNNTVTQEYDDVSALPDEMVNIVLEYSLVLSIFFVTFYKELQIKNLIFSF